MSILSFEKIISDLHIHSTHSDGTFSFKEIIKKSKEQGLEYISITDHDSIDCYKEDFFLQNYKSVQKTSDNNILDNNILDNNILNNNPMGYDCFYTVDGINIIIGIELSTMDIPEKGFFDIHVLGYNIDFLNKELNNELKKINQARIDQKKEVIRILHDDHGFDITFDEVLKRAGGIIGKPHIVETILDKKGYTGKNRLAEKEKMYRLMGDKVNVPKSYLLSIADSVELIHKCGGLAVLAHPGIYAQDLAVIDHSLQSGIDGVEVYYAYDFSPFQDGIRPETSGRLIKKYEDYLKDPFEEQERNHKNIVENTIRSGTRNFYFTGGSDFHGSIKQIEIGEGGIDSFHTERLLAGLSNNH